MTWKGKCNSKSNSFVAASEQVCLQPVLEHRQRRGRRNTMPMKRTGVRPSVCPSVRHCHRLTAEAAGLLLSAGAGRSRAACAECQLSVDIYCRRPRLAAAAGSVMS